MVADVHSRQQRHNHHHPYDTPEKDETATPTNEAAPEVASEDDDVVSGRSDPTYGAADDLNSSGSRNSDSSTRVNPPESVYAAHAHPTAPERTSSILRREQQLYQVRISLQKFDLTYLESKLLGSANRVTKLDDKNL